MNDHTLQERDFTVIRDDADWYRESSISREFNFLSRQRTTTTEFLLWNKKQSSTSTSVAVTIDNFRDIEGQEEIARAHRQLVLLGGKPPALDEVLDRLPKARLAPKA